MANKFKVINNTVNDKLVGLQFATDGGTPLFTVGNFQIETTFSEKQNKDYSIGEASEYLTLDDIGETTPQDNLLRKNKTKLILNPDYTQPKTYSYFGSLKEYFRVNVEQIIINWPASIYVDNVINTFTGNTIQSYIYNPVTNKSTFNVNNSFFINYFDIKYVSQYNSNESLDNPLRNLNVEYAKYTIFYNDVEYPINSYTGSSQPYNDNVYFEVTGNPFPLATGGTLSTKYHIKPNSVEVEKFFSSLSDLSTQLLDRYVQPPYSSKFTYFKASEQGPYDIYVNQLFTWPVVDGYNLDIVTTGYTTYLSDLYQFCDYFDENDTNIMNRRLVAEAINRLNKIRRGDGSDDENEAERVSRLINIYGREFDEVKKYIDGLSYIRTLTYDKNGNTPDSLVKDLASTLGWSLLTPMSDVDLISSFIPTQSVYSGYTINYSKYDAEIEFWRRLIVNTAHIFRSKGSRKAIEFIFDFIGTPEQLVSFNEHIYMAKKPINVDIFKLILKELTGFDDITSFNIDENGYPKVLPETAYNYYQSDGLWYRETAGSGTNLNIFEGNNPHIGPYDGGKSYINQFRCLIDTFSATSVSIFNEYIVFTNLFKNYSNGLIDDYSGIVYLNSYDLNGRPNICFTVTGTVTTDPDPQYVLGLCGCPISLSDQALVLGIKKNDSFKPCNVSVTTITGTSVGVGIGIDVGIGTSTPLFKCLYSAQSTKNAPPIILFSGFNSTNIEEIPLECCKSNSLIPNATWIETTNSLGYCYWLTDCGKIKIIGSSNGNLIFYDTTTGVSGTTTQQLGVNITECCAYFGGVINSTTGTCNIIPKTITTGLVTGTISALTGRTVTTFGRMTDLGSVLSQSESATLCPDPSSIQISMNNVVLDSSTNQTIPQECCTKKILGFNVSWNGKQCVVERPTGCQLTPIRDLNNNLVLNGNGTISFIDGVGVIQPPTLECCTAYSTTELPLTFCGGNCYWVNPTQSCNDIDDFKVSLGVDGNDGVYLFSGSNETCYFQVEFDMLVNFNCSEFLTCVGQEDILPILSAFTINATVENTTGTTLQTFPAFNFNINNKPTGVYFSGQESACNAVNNEILLELGDNCNIVTEETFASKWVNVKFNISNQIIGQKIKLGFQFINVPCGFNFLLDNIKIDRLCIVTNEDILNVTNCVGFDLERIIDNKKSWEYTESSTLRSVDYLDYRDTYYIEDDSRLLINTKEVDLTLDAAKAIDNDVFCYAVKNDCFFQSNGCGYSCPDGYTLLDDGVTCQKIEYTAVTSATTIYTAAMGTLRCDFNVTYGENGGIFYPNISTLSLPLNVSGGSLHNQSTVIDVSGYTVPIQETILNSVWGSGATTCSFPCTPACTEGYYNRLNQVGIWTTIPGTPLNEWIGFSFCVDLPYDGTYTLGIAMDDIGRVKINGDLILNFSGSGWNFLSWRMFPIPLTSGLNIVEMEVKNTVVGGATLGAEIYSADTNIISGITSTSALTEYIVFSTKDYVGKTWELGESSGYSCPEGYSLDTCNGTGFTCSKILKSSVVQDCSSGTTIIPDPYISQYKDEIDSLDNVEKFKNFVLTRLIDPKSRQVIRDYPLLRYVYNKYLNLCGNNICDDLGNQYNYNSLQSFIELIGDYWIELVEQLVPSTALWKGATRFYRNTIFDQPKYKYKNYSLLTCDPDCTEIYSGSSYCLLTLGKEILLPIQGLVKDLKEPRTYSTDITNCWYNFFNQNGGVISDASNIIPPQILESINSGNNTLSYASLTVNGVISGNTIFNSQIISGTTIGALTSTTANNILNTIISGLTQNGYTATTDSSGIYITSPTNDDCGKIMDFNFCLDLSLSGISGTTSAFNYPNTIDTPITVGGNMSDMARNISNNSLYVLNDVVKGSITVIDCTTDTISTTINLSGGQYPQRITYNSTNNTMYVLAYSTSMSGLVFVINCTTNTVITSIPLTFNPNYCDIIYTSSNNRVYVSDFINNKIIAIDCNTNTIITTFPSAPINGFSYPGRMGYNPTNNRVYCTTVGSGIFMIDCNTNTIITPPIPINGDYITYDSINNRMYLTNYGAGTIRYIDCNTNIISTATTIGSQPLLVEYCPPYNVIFVSYIGSGNLRVINATNMTVIQNFVGLTGNVYGITYNPVNNQLYLASQETGNITVLSAPTVNAVVTANCKTCETLFTGEFKEIFSGTSTLVCGTNECGYVGYKDNGVEVIIEPINIITSTGTTSSNCIETNNQTICSKIFITNINDDVMFGGNFLRYK